MCYERYSQIDRETDRQGNRQTNRQTYIHTLVSKHLKPPPMENHGNAEINRQPDIGAIYRLNTMNFLYPDLITWPTRATQAIMSTNKQNSAPPSTIEAYFIMFVDTTRAAPSRRATPSSTSSSSNINNGITTTTTTSPKPRLSDQRRANSGKPPNVCLAPPNVFADLSPIAGRWESFRSATLKRKQTSRQLTRKWNLKPSHGRLSFAAAFPLTVSDTALRL